MHSLKSSEVFSDEFIIGFKKIETQAFPDPFSSTPETFIYKTGDLVKYHPDGNIEYFNRLDNQIKLRGFRIELGEIEAVIGTYPVIKQTIAGIKEIGLGDRRLICYYISQNDVTIDVGDLRSHLRKKLPEYMVPQHFIELEEFPLTPAGKIDRKVLISREWNTSAQEENYIAPQDELEVQLTEIWQEVLHHKPIGITDNFFDIGGHSLLATQIISRMNNNIGVNISLRSFFQAPTVADMAAIISQQRVEEADSKDIDRLLTELEELSDREVHRRFQDKMLGDESKK